MHFLHQLYVQVFLPSGSFMVIGSMLQSARLFISRRDVNVTDGLCQSSASIGGWKVASSKSLFVGKFDPKLNTTLRPGTADNCSQCTNDQCWSNDLTGCFGRTGSTFLEEALSLGRNGDFMAFTNVNMSESKSKENAVLLAGQELENEEGVAQIFLSISGPQRSPPSEGESCSRCGFSKLNQ